APSDYWAASYVQTADIDLADDHANIVPIGDTNSAANQFEGDYDGNYHTISNWGFTGDERYAGLFGYVAYASLKSIRLSGVWTLSNTASYAWSGFLAGYAYGTTVSHIDGDFSAGTLLGGSNSCGGFFG
ncbi:unnamed protein product, partial [Ectocarpus sp. 12 AP-2014]